MTDALAPADRRCGSCSAPLNAEWSVCRRCGTVQPVATSAEQERSLLHEWGMVASWALDAGRDDSPDVVAVARNGLIPTDPELLVEEAERCIRFLREGKTPFQGRLDAIITRLELLALKEPVLGRRVEVLRKSAQELAARDRRENTGCIAGFVGALAVIAALVAFGISRC